MAEGLFLLINFPFISVKRTPKKVASNATIIPHQSLRGIENNYHTDQSNNSAKEFVYQKFPFIKKWL